jgi:hypothetical protein
MRRVWLSLERLCHDLRYGIRVLVKNPALTTISIVSIAFGTGANVAIFSVADALLLRPLPVLRPSELLTIGFKVRNGIVYRNYSSYPDYLDSYVRRVALQALPVRGRPRRITTNLGGRQTAARVQHTD